MVNFSSPFHFGDIHMFCCDFHKFCLNFWNHWNSRHASFVTSPTFLCNLLHIHWLNRHQGEAALKRFKYLAKNEDAPWLSALPVHVLSNNGGYPSIFLSRENVVSIVQNLGCFPIWGWPFFFQTNSNGWTTWGRFSHWKEEYQWISCILSSFKLFAWRFWLKQSWLYVPARDNLLGYP